MHYKFPEIRTINDILPHIQGRKEFVVAEREDFGTVINYRFARAETFQMSDDDDHSGAIRRECRGIIFDQDGNIMSRPFHKFFNINERDETKEEVMESSILKQAHVVMEKMDGSMIRPLIDARGNLRLGTKMGLTDIAKNAETWLMKQIDHAEKLNWLRLMVDSGITPLFEWVSPENQIVLEYKEEDLVYLGSRKNITGEYFMDEKDDVPFNQVPQYGSVQGNIKKYIDRQRQAKNREGDVIRFEDGHMIKVKNDWYVDVHKNISTSATFTMSRSHNIAKLILEDKLDDVIPHLSEHRLKSVRHFEQLFWDAFQQTEDRLSNLKKTVIQLGYQNDRKSIALEILPTLESKYDGKLLFEIVKALDEDVHSVLVKHVSKVVTSERTWNEVAQWMGVDMPH